MSPKIIDKEQRKYEIALVALELFGEKGFELTSISEVAQKAGIGKGTIYEYFASKEELILSAMMVWVDQMMQGIDGLMEGITDPVERLRTYANASIEAFISNEHTIKIMINMFQVMLTGDMMSKQHPMVGEMMQALRKTLVDTILDGVSLGVFKPEIARDAEKIAINLFAYLDGIGFHYLIGKSHFDVMAQVDFYLDSLIENLRKE